MMKFRENEDAVSPVIGVILMVAITVILAAVIAAFVFGMTGDMDTHKQVYVTTSIDANSIMKVTIQGGSDVSSLTAITVTGATEDKPFAAAGPYAVGDSGTYKELTDNVIIKGVFADGTTQILAERSVA